MSLQNFKNEVLVRVYMVTIIVLMVAVAIIVKATRLVVVEGDMWRKRSVDKYVSYRDVLGDRGNILSADGSLLATSIPYYDIYWDPSPVALDDDVFKLNLDSLAISISSYLTPNITAEAWKEALWQNHTNKNIHYVPIAKNLTYDQMQVVKNFPLFRYGKNVGGFIAVKINKREHPFKTLALRTLGYVKDGANPIGLEGKFDKTLSGDAGKMLVQKLNTAGDIVVPINDLAEIEPRNGVDLVTTLDVNIQDITQSALIHTLNTFQAEHGCAIVMEVKTGKIKAISNIGKSEDGKNWWEDYNYAIGTAIEPGSTWKLASVLSLLEDGAIHLSDTVDIENGSTQYYDAVLEDHERTNKRLITVKEAFSQSSNVGISKLVFQAYKDKPKAYIKHLKDFMLSVPTDIEVLGEAAPYIKDPENAADQWSGISLPWMSIGYELKITPLQLLTFYNAVANDGQMMKPYLVSETQRYGETLQTYKPTVIKKRIASKNSIDQAKELLESVIEPGGTAAKWRTPNYRFAGKTGTAQLNYAQEKTSKHTGGYQGSFVGYFPADNPVYSCIVVIYKPKSGFYGGVVAAPVFREIADKLTSSNIALSEPINEKGKPIPSPETLPSDVGLRTDLLKTLQNVLLKHEIVGDINNEWTTVRPQSDTLMVAPKNIGTKKQIPSVIGMGLMDALYLLENRGLRVSFSGYGKVISQSLTPNGTAVSGQSISIKLE